MGDGATAIHYVPDETATGPVSAGKPWDILFLVSQVAQGTQYGHFGSQCRTPSAQRALAWRCAKVVVGRHLPWFVTPGHFLVAQRDGDAVGAALVVCLRSPHQNHSMLEYLVVDDRFRGNGVGAALVDAALCTVPPGGTLLCQCAPTSRVMRRLLIRFGFKREHESTVFHSISAGRPVLIPSLWFRRC